MAEFSTPGIYVQEISPGMSRIPVCSTSTAAFVGKSEKGDPNRAVLIQTMQAYRDHFGGETEGSFLAQSVDQFFMNGGQKCYVVRVLPPSSAREASEPDAFLKAFHALDNFQDIGLLAAPGIGTPWLVDAGMSYCEKRQDLFFIGEAGPGDNSVSKALDFKKNIHTQGSRAALYFPWVFALSGRRPVLSPPSGCIAGAYASTDIRKGVWKAPAGTNALLRGVLKPACSLVDSDQDLLNPAGINAIRRFQGTGTMVWGARTLSQISEWRYVPVRRTATMIETSISRGTAWAVFEPNNANLWSRLRQQISEFLSRLWQDGALQGSKPSEAFFVNCGLGETMTRSDRDQGRVVVSMGLALLKPAEFIVLQIAHMTSNS